jgi:hypothetical protein
VTQMPCHTGGQRYGTSQLDASTDTYMAPDTWIGAISLTVGSMLPRHGSGLNGWWYHRAGVAGRVACFMHGTPANQLHTAVYWLSNNYIQTILVSHSNLRQCQEKRLPSRLPAFTGWRAGGWHVYRRVGQQEGRADGCRDSVVGPTASSNSPAQHTGAI